MRQCSYDWIRDGDGEPKQNANGTYTMVEKMGACFAFTPETIDDVRELLNDIIGDGRKFVRITDAPVVCSQCREIVPIKEQDTHC